MKIINKELWKDHVADYYAHERRDYMQLPRNISNLAGYRAAFGIRSIPGWRRHKSANATKGKIRGDDWGWVLSVYTSLERLDRALPGGFSDSELKGMEVEYQDERIYSS